MQLSFGTRLRKILAHPDIALDLGTANTRLYAHGCGLLADEPSVVQVRRETGSVEAVDFTATHMPLLERGARLLSPLRAGVVADVDAATALLKPLLKRARRFGLFRPRVLACAPTDACEAERNALTEAARRAGAAAVVLVPEPLAAAIGIGMDVSSEHAQMLVDIGDGVTDIAVIRAGELVATAAARTACSDLIQVVAKLIAEQEGVNIYSREAQRLIKQIGTGRQALPATPFVIAGADCDSRLLRRVYVQGESVAAAMQPVLAVIVNAVTQSLRDLPDELACEVIESGIHLTGGGAHLTGLAELLAAETSLEVRPARNPMHAVINGARQMLAVGVQTNIWSMN
ncbi:MAG: rod shape-determining protein [Acidobacteria bacterium]|nr:rod shape-determining protein [Acidobacteriota bacterium]MBI3426550.1 rod shape-determining protein [Acidobacteriota bacterium]